MHDKRFTVEHDRLMALVTEQAGNLDDSPLTSPRLLLPWDERGLLPFKYITMNQSQLLDSPFVTGYGSKVSCWDRNHRREIARDLASALRSLSVLGINEVFAGGEFVERIARPAGVEGYFRVDGDAFPMPVLQEYLATIEPRRNWGWFPLQNAYTQPVVRLYPVFQYRRDTVIEVPLVPVDHFQRDAEGNQKGVLRLIAA